MTNDSESTSFSAAAKWWVSAQGKAEGPFAESYVADALRSGQISNAALACPVGGTEWKPVGRWPEFLEFAPTEPQEVPPPPPIHSLDDSPLTNPKLPVIANWICVYAIVVCPAWWVMDNLAFCVTGSVFHEDSQLFGLEVLLGIGDFFVSLVATVFMVIGGLKLRRLQSSGPQILKLTMLAFIAFSMFEVLLLLGLAAASSEGDFSEPTPAGDVISFFTSFVSLGLLAFEIYAIVWLHRNAARLPLENR